MLIYQKKLNGFFFFNVIVVATYELKIMTQTQIDQNELNYTIEYHNTNYYFVRNSSIYIMNSFE